jgi:hypothetical protein
MRRGLTEFRIPAISGRGDDTSQIPEPARYYLVRLCHRPGDRFVLVPPLALWEHALSNRERKKGGAFQ